MTRSTDVPDDDWTRHERPLLTVDTVVFTLIKSRLHVLLIKRAAAPQAGRWALPGGFVHVGEDADTEAAARRALANKTGLTLTHMEQLHTFSGALRDARAWSVCVVYLALVASDACGGLGRDAQWVDADNLPDMPFDHNLIVEHALTRVRNKASYSSLPALCLPPVFSLPELKKVYEHVLGASLNESAFRRKVFAQGLVVPADTQKSDTKVAGRPAQLYRLAQQGVHDFGRVVVTPDDRRGG